MPIHHNFKQKQKIIIKLRNGKNIVDKYIDTKANYLITEKYKVKWDEIKFTAIFKERSS